MGLQLVDLPKELLQLIFLHSKNVNLPLCSGVIGAKLSHEEAFRQVSVHHLFQAESSNVNAKPDDDLTHTAQYRILAAKFMTIARLERYMGVALTRAPWPCSVNPHFVVYTALKQSLYTTTPGVEQCLCSPKPDNDAYEPHYWYEVANLSNLRERAAIPSKLLVADLTSEQAKFLHFLLRCGLRVARSHRQAFEQRRLEIFRIAAVFENRVHLACLFSYQLGLRVTPALLKTALIDFEIPPMMLEVILLADVVRTDDDWYTSSTPRDICRIDEWVAEEKRHGMLGAWEVERIFERHRLLRQRLPEPRPGLFARRLIMHAQIVVPTSFEKTSETNKRYGKASPGVRMGDWMRRSWDKMAARL